MKILTTSLLVAFAAPVFGDIFTLKDGTTLDADIIEKTLEEYVLEVRITKSIKERRTIKREDVASVERVSQADTEFEKIAKLAPAPPFLSVEGYDERIKPIKAFLAAHKLTGSGTKATKMLKELEEERALVQAGGLKVSEGEFLTKEERGSDIITIESQILLQKFKALTSARSYTAALRQYDGLESEFFGSQAHRDAVPLMTKLVSTYRAILLPQLDGFEKSEMQRMQSIEQLSDTDIARAKAADMAHAEQFEKVWMKEKESSQRWLSTNLKDANSIENTVVALENELDRLVAVNEDLAKIPETGGLFKEGWEAAGKKEQQKLEDIFDQMDAAGVDEQYFDLLVDRFDPTINQPVEEDSELTE